MSASKGTEVVIPVNGIFTSFLLVASRTPRKVERGTMKNAILAILCMEFAAFAQEC